MTPYGYTCDNCPSRGLREVVGDFIPLDHYEKIPLPQGFFSGQGNVDHYWRIAAGVKYVPIGFPDRCKKCNANYQRAKRARECVNRLSYVMEDSRIKYLKFVTLTHESMSSKWRLEPTSKNAVAEFYDWFVDAREDLIDRFGARSGTDVLECIEHTWVCPIFGFEFKRYHVHQHGIWLVPFIKFKVFNEWKKTKKVGRSEITSIKDILNDDGSRTKWLYQAIDYLAKYISKENTHVKRMVWGDVRKWRDYAPIDKRLICKKHVKNTFDIAQLLAGKKEVCDCLE